ncbi:966_t:CDS:2 [Ambispora leptoticha]|uniref:966_t:CDS:1 n=1 Tax=Ambispora leptoticha TaxID=144679 RepID=A0A9N9D2S3_9GLOM|nr:966_t:CDS:2 [Ambispora leptoticha]
MTQPYRIQEVVSEFSHKAYNNTGMARNRRGDKIPRTTTGETSMNSNEPASTVEEVTESSDSKKEKNNEQIQPENYTQNLESAPSPEVIELSDSEEQVQPENSNNSSSQNDTQNAIQHEAEPDYDNEEVLNYDNEEELDYDNIEPNIMEIQAEIREELFIRPDTFSN